jgi:hypothetical protein
MKHAITGPQGRIHRISDTAVIREGVTVSAEITDQQATIFASAADPIGYWIIEGTFTTGADKALAERAARQATIQANRAAAEAARIAAMSPQERASHNAFNAAAAVFESMTLGKQALWETTRSKVADFIKKGEFAKAYETIATVPSLYPEMEDDRAAFLALFQ